MHQFNPKKIYNQILDKANEDGIITSDEQAIIDSIKSNISKYQEILEDSYEDEIITAEEQNDMYLSRKHMLEEALSIAKEDNKITQDEFKLLKIIRQIIGEMENQEHY